MRPSGVQGQARAGAGYGKFSGCAEAGFFADDVMKQVDNPGIQAGMSKPCELDNPEYPVYSPYTLF
jgi:hypothetical protein